MSHQFVASWSSFHASLCSAGRNQLLISWSPYKLLKDLVTFIVLVLFITWSGVFLVVSFKTSAIKMVNEKKLIIKFKAISLLKVKSLKILTISEPDWRKNSLPPALESISFKCILYSAWSRTMSLYRKLPPKTRKVIDFSILTSQIVLYSCITLKMLIRFLLLHSNSESWSQNTWKVMQIRGNWNIFSAVFKRWPHAVEVYTRLFRG